MQRKRKATAIRPKGGNQTKSEGRKQRSTSKSFTPIQRFRPKGKTQSKKRIKEQRSANKVLPSPQRFRQRRRAASQHKKIPSSVSGRKAEKRSTAKRSAGCLSEASSCASDERSFAAGPKRQTAVFLFVTFFFLPPKRKSKNKPKQLKVNS